MSSSEGEDIFEDSMEEAGYDNAQTVVETEEVPSSGYPSSPATNKQGSRSSESPRVNREHQIQQRFQAARAEYDNRRYVACRDKCMDILHQRNLPSITRCLTLQLLASCSYYYGAKTALEQALKIASQLGDTAEYVSLRRDIEELLEELEQYRPIPGEPRVYIKELEEDDH